MMTISSRSRSRSRSRSQCRQNLPFLVVACYCLVLFSSTTTTTTFIHAQQQQQLDDPPPLPHLRGGADSKQQQEEQQDPAVSVVANTPVYVQDWDTDITSPHFFTSVVRHERNDDGVIDAFDDGVDESSSTAITAPQEGGGQDHSHGHGHRSLQTWTSATHRTVLILRVTIWAGGRQYIPSVSSSQLRTATFSTLANQMRSCSDNMIHLRAANYGNGGVEEVSLSTGDLDDHYAVAAQAETAARNLLGDNINPRSVCDHLMVVLPDVNWPNFSTAWAEIVSGGHTNGRAAQSIYNDDLSISRAILMHEFGHNLGLYHSGLNGDAYGDVSGNMGRSDINSNPLMCYNAANHWQLGWFAGNRREVDPARDGIQTINLVAFAHSNYGNNPVLVKIKNKNVYMQFNMKTGNNVGTQYMANQLAIIQDNGSSGTSVVTGLGQGQSREFSGYAVAVCQISGTTMKISIGQSSTNCNAGGQQQQQQQQQQTTSTTSNTWENTNPSWFNNNQPKPPTTSWTPNWVVSTNNNNNQPTTNQWSNNLNNNNNNWNNNNNNNNAPQWTTYTPPTNTWSTNTNTFQSWNAPKTTTTSTWSSNFRTTNSNTPSTTTKPWTSSTSSWTSTSSWSSWGNRLLKTWFCDVDDEDCFFG